MPIKPENRGRYPADWPEIRERILRRARYTCEHEGCTAKHHQVGLWRSDAWEPLAARLREAGYKPGDTVRTTMGDFKVIKIVLTIAHLDHQPENCADENLRAWCQRHHLRYDAQHHAVNAARTRHANANTMELPLE
jgi:hypothetical protein